VVHADRRFQAEQHVSSAIHQTMVNHQTTRKEEKQKLIHQSLNECDASVSKKSKFNEDLCKAFVAANIPLWKLKNETFRAFLEQYTHQVIPDESTIRKRYVGDCYNETIEQIRSDICNELIWISVDETTDCEGRYIANVVVGALKSQSKPYLLTTEVLEHTNHHTVAKVFNEALQLLWPAGIMYEKVLLFVSDAAAYMKKAGDGLKVLFPKMIHVTCVAHGLHRVAETIRVYYPEVDRLISSTKKVFCKAPNRVRLFRTIAPDIPLPPQPILTRWGTWLNAAEYYADNFDTILAVLDQLCDDDAASIAAAKVQFKKPGIRQHLAYIKTWFSNLPKAISHLEDSKLSLVESVGLLNKLKLDFLSAPGDGANAAGMKLNQVLNKNDGLSKLSCVAKILDGEENTLLGGEENYTPSDIAAYLYAPIVSCDVERSFSRYKTLLADNRRSLKFENLKHLFVAYCNSADSE